jgi:hypothetical protein
MTKLVILTLSITLIQSVLRFMRLWLIFAIDWPHSRTSVNQKGRNVTGLPSGSLYTPRVIPLLIPLILVYYKVVPLYAPGLTLGVPGPDDEAAGAQSASQSTLTYC